MCVQSSILSVGIQTYPSVCGVNQVDALMVGGQEAGPNSALTVLLLVVVVVGVLDGLSQGAIFGDAADLPPLYTHVSLQGGSGSPKFDRSSLGLLNTLRKFDYGRYLLC